MRPAGRYRDTNINSVHQNWLCSGAQRAADYRVNLRRQSDGHIDERGRQHRRAVASGNIDVQGRVLIDRV